MALAFISGVQKIRSSQTLTEPIAEPPALLPIVGIDSTTKKPAREILDVKERLGFGWVSAGLAIQPPEVNLCGHTDICEPMRT
jgi:hypothetical protein